jgi:hypothetical protein
MDEKLKELIIAAKRVLPGLQKSVEFAQYSSPEYKRVEKFTNLVEEFAEVLGIE